MDDLKNTFKFFGIVHACGKPLKREFKYWGKNGK